MHEGTNYYRCRDCLTIATCDKTPAQMYDAICDGCSGRIQWLGTVSGRPGWLKKTELQPPCDGRCTGASGPNCDCQCNGTNHGSGLLVEVITHEDKIPRIVPQNRAACAARALEYIDAKLAAVARIDNLYPGIRERIKNGVWVDSGYFEVTGLQSEVNHAASLKTHKGRIRALEAIAQTHAVA